jgi:hypothetical protein
LRSRVGPPTPLQSAAHAVTSVRCDSLSSVLYAAPSARDRLSSIHREPSPHSSQAGSRAFRERKTPPPAKEHSFCLLPKTELHRPSRAPANLQISPQPGRLKSSLQSAVTTRTLRWKPRKRPPAPAAWTRENYFSLIRVFRGFVQSSSKSAPSPLPC